MSLGASSPPQPPTALQDIWELLPWSALRQQQRLLKASLPWQISVLSSAALGQLLPSRGVGPYPCILPIPGSSLFLDPHILLKPGLSISQPSPILNPPHPIPASFQALHPCILPKPASSSSHPCILSIPEPIPVSLLSRSSLHPPHPCPWPPFPAPLCLALGMVQPCPQRPPLRGRCWKVKAALRGLRRPHPAPTLAGREKGWKGPRAQLRAHPSRGPGRSHDPGEGRREAGAGRISPSLLHNGAFGGGKGGGGKGFEE